MVMVSSASPGPMTKAWSDYVANFKAAEWTTSLLGADVKGRYADLKQGSADRCARLLGTVVKAPEVQYHHEVYNQFLWNMF
jgi:glutamine synthetase